jgi:hypothetical protein
MVRDVVVTFSEGKLNLPRAVREEMHLVEGSKLRLISSSKDTWTFARDEKPEAVDGKEPIWLGNRWWVPNDDWRKLQGILSDHPEHDTTAARHADRIWELEHDERKFGPFPKR